MDALIKQSMLDKDNVRTSVLRAIKNEFLIHQTAKGANPLTDADEFAILKRMVKQRLDSRDQYQQAGRKDLALIESKEILVLETFLPREASTEETIGAIFKVAQDKGWVVGNGSDTPFSCKIPKKLMGETIKLVKAELPNVDGKTLSELIRNYLV